MYPCGCVGRTLECELSKQISAIQEVLVPQLQDNTPWKLEQFWECGNWHMGRFESRQLHVQLLQQFLNNPVLLPRFALACTPRLEAALHYKLRNFVGLEQTFVLDNSGVLDENQKKNLQIQSQLLRKADKVKNLYSLSLFLIEYLNEWNIKDCNGA